MRREEVGPLARFVRGAALGGGVAAWVALLSCGAPAIDAVDVTLPGAPVEPPHVAEGSARPSRPEAEPPPIALEPWTADVSRRARADARPVLVVVCARWVVACAHLERDVLTTVAVRAVAEPYVAAQLDLSGAASVDDEARRALGVAHVPAVLLVSPTGRRVELFRSDDLEAPALAAALDEFARD